LELPADHPRPAAASHRGGKGIVGIGTEIHEGLRRLSQREGATLFMVLMAAFKVVLMRYSGEEDVVVGTAIANRTRKEVEGLIGFFVNTLVLRTDLSGNPSFRELIRREREVALGAYAHQEVPFEKLVEEINPDRDLSRSPLFQVMMVLQNAAREDLGMEGVKLTDVSGEAEAEGEFQTVRFDLMISIADLGQELVGDINYSRDLFEWETIERLMNHYTNLLDGIVKDSEQPIWSLSLLSDKEREQITVEWNETARPYPNDRCMHELLAEQTERGPERIALVCERQQVSYRELNRRANQLGHYLQKQGVGPEVVVGVCMERSVEMVVGVLGVLKAGGVYLPLDPESPLERLSYMLEDAGVRVILTQGILEDRLPVYMGRTVYLDEEWERIDEERESEPESGVGAENLAYVIYTSGSTGQPKGVGVSNRGLINLIYWHQQEFDVSDADHATQLAGISFDASIWEVWPYLTAGANLHIVEEAKRGDVQELIKWMVAEGITIGFLPTPLAELALSERWPEATSLRMMLTGGDKLRSAAQTAPPFKLINNYGPTEYTVVATSIRLEDSCKEAPPIGRGIANTHVYLLDERLEPVPVGVRGELYISGAGLARGYLGKPELTAETFIPHFFSCESNGRLYRTGDIGRYLPDGNIDFVGRVDHQVKLRGYRIELGEIEAVLNEHPSVRQSVVIAREDERGSARLYGYVVGEGETMVAELKTQVRERLPRYMVPESIQVLEEMPLTVNGKIDRKRLPILEGGADRAVEQEYLASRTPVEEILVGIYEEVLRLDRVGIRDNFFEVGGHSLLAASVLSRVRSTFGVEIGVRNIFEEPTVEGLAGRIEEAMKAGEKDKAPPLVRVERESQGSVRLPLSFAQQRLWFIDQLDPGNTTYNIPGGVRLEGRLNLQVLESAINEIVRRHEVLRTRIEVEEGKPIQVIDEWKPQRLEIVYLTHLSPEKKEDEVWRLMKEEAKTGFDLSRGPLLRVKALKLEEEEHILLYTMHHIVSDAGSMVVLMREVSALYEAISEGKISPLPELKIQYADYACWQRRYLSGEVLERHLQYWKKQLDGKLPVMNLPGDHLRPPISSYRGAAKSIPLPAKLYESLKELSKGEGVTMFMVLLAAFKTQLYKSTSQEDIIVGAHWLNRDRAELEPLVGFFVNMLPLRTNLSGNPGFRELLRRVKDVALGAYTHQELPFERLVEEIRPERRARQTPLYNVVFGVQNEREEEVRLSGLKISPVGTERESVKVDLMLSINEGAGAMEVRWIYSTDLFEEETIIRMHGHFETLLSSIVARPDAPLDELEMFSDAERAQQATSRAAREESNYSRFKSVKPKAIPLSDS
jgi:amino acid adenylation domain-containing protein